MARDSGVQNPVGRYYTEWVGNYHRGILNDLQLDLLEFSLTVAGYFQLIDGIAEKVVPGRHKVVWQIKHYSLQLLGR